MNPSGLSGASDFGVDSKIVRFEMSDTRNGWKLLVESGLASILRGWIGSTLPARKVSIADRLALSDRSLGTIFSVAALTAAVTRLNKLASMSIDDVCDF